MKVSVLLTKYKGPDVLKPYYSLKGLILPSLDSKGSVVKEWLYRQKKIKEGSAFFADFNDEDLKAFLEDLQNLSHKFEYRSSHTSEEKAVLRAFRRSIKKIQKSGSNFL
ncbi:MAG: hypothetical protein EP346_01690 [Bacteroidetes bacterium]|uniref:Uncharacterized protein n=1 Tax=Phaeocystidibacter marisrubri TaxID=1577780 RepID=A0A6L3ZK47_9FLAO|nr:hypothetical protein [Phaeocystidibacter marisrubri]KAB2817795.1 hypothetical protein F8C82_05160 [Phaeocystidibacter marisrubri]TNE31223.1 MAG: hypothetical protein EP346_01690 [Bacteroidota bacterium]GGH73499.1 hypothetical protein GCM10011318_18580 [Phaeocystidibacter marisrubri]